MADSYHHGVRVIEVNDGASRTISTVATAVIGLVATGPAADATLFPIGKTALITNLPAAIAKAGPSGTLRQALQAIYNQANTIVVVVRVTAGADAAATTTAVVAGVKVLLTAEAVTRYKPRIIGAPGLDSQPVAAQLAITAKKLRAMAYVSAYQCTTVETALDYRAEFDSRELMVIMGDFLAWDAVADANVTIPAVAVALGLRAQLDKTIGWHKVISNVPAAGVTGVTVPLSFDIADSDTDVGALNAAGVTCVINQLGGYRFWGSRTCSEDELFIFESDTRTAQILADTVAAGNAWAIDKPLHPQLARDVIENLNAFLRTMKGDSIIDGKAWLNDTENTSANLKIGKLAIDYDYTAVPPLEDLTLRQRVTSSYLDDFAAQVNA
jgi:phage tail sheath protein FI